MRALVWLNRSNPTLQNTMDRALQEKKKGLANVSIYIAYDAKSLRLYVTMHQIFRIWAIPFFNAPVTLTTVLQLVSKPYPTPHHPNKRDLYFIQSQNDLYQVNEWIKFVSQFGVLSLFIFIWQLVATGFCVLGAFAFWPVSWLEQNVIGGNRERGFGEAIKG